MASVRRRPLERSQVVHGGFWKQQWTVLNAAHETVAPFAAARGWLAVEAEYRRREDAGWPGTVVHVATTGRRTSTGSDGTASAAHASHPEWVIRLAVHQANSIMDANRAGHYSLAVQWLEKAALAHEVLGREDDWRACLDELIERHRRKYKLRPLLEGLRGR